MMGLEYPKTAEPVYNNHVPARKRKENQGEGKIWCKVPVSYSFKKRYSFSTQSTVFWQRPLDLWSSHWVLIRQKYLI